MTLLTARIKHCLSALFEDKNIITIKDGEVELRQKMKNTGIMKISLTGLTESTTLVVKFPRNLKGGLRGDKVCDYFVMVFSPKVEIFFIELKKTQNPENIGSSAIQIRHSMPLWHYILSAFKVHCDYEPPNAPQKYSIVLSNQRGRKKGTIPIDNPYQDINYPEVYSYITGSLSLDRIRNRCNIKTYKKIN